MVAGMRIFAAQRGQRSTSNPKVRFIRTALYIHAVSVSSAGAPQNGLRFERLDWTWARQRKTLTHVQ